MRTATLQYLTDDSDPTANLVVGNYLCTRRDAWRLGLPLLAMAADQTLAKLARDDLGG